MSNVNGKYLYEFFYSVFLFLRFSTAYCAREKLVLGHFLVMPMQRDCVACCRSRVAGSPRDVCLNLRTQFS